MYTVSNDYLTALATDPIHDIVQLRFWINGALAFTMNPRNIIPGSLSIQKQCMNNDGFGVGGVYAGEMSVTLIPDADFDLFDYDVANAEIRVIYKLGLRKENNEWVYEDIPLGRFLVDDIDYQSKGIYQISAYDKMTLFTDTDIDEAIHGTARQVINSLCTLAGVDLATTAAQFEDFINSALTYRIKPKWVDNARDALSYVCSCIGCFATIGRTGDLEIRPLTLDYSEYDDSLSRNERLTSFAAMGKTRVRRVRGNFVTTVTDENNESKRVFVKYKANTGRAKGGILDLGDNPAQWNDMQEVVDNLAEELYNVNYTAATFTTISNPIYDLGDRIRIVHPDSGKTVITLLTAIEWKFHGIQTCKGFGAEKGIRGKSQKSIDSTNETVASNELISVAVTINAAVNDTVVVTDEDSNVLATVVFASGETSGVADLKLQSPGQTLTFTSAVLSKHLTIYVDSDTEIFIASASGNWELYIQLYTDRSDQSNTGVQFVVNDADELEFVDLTSEIGYFTTNMMYRDSTTDSFYRPRAGKDCKAFFSNTSIRDYVADSIMDAMDFSSQSFLACWTRATVYNQNSLLGLPNDYDEIAMVSGYLYNGSVSGMYITLMLRDRKVNVYAAHLYGRACTYSNVDWTTDTDNKPVYKFQTVFKFEGSVKVLEIDSTGYEWHEYNPANALLDLSFSKPIIAFTKPQKSEYEIFMWNGAYPNIAIYRGANKVPITVTDSPATGEYRIYGDYAEYISKDSDLSNSITLYEDVNDVIVLCCQYISGQGNVNFDVHLGAKSKGDVISIDSENYPSLGWRAIIIIKNSTTVLPDEFAIMRYYRNSDLYGFFFNGKTRRVSTIMDQGKYMYKQYNTLYTDSEFAGDVILQNGLGNSDNSKIAVADNTVLAGWGFYLAEAYYDENAWKERYIGTFTYDSSTSTQSLQGAVREYKIREMYGPESNIFGMVEIKYRNASGEGDEYLKYYLNAVFIYTTDLSVIGMRFEEIVNDDIIDMDSDIYHKWRSITSTNGNEYAYIRLLAVTKSVSVDAGVQTIFDYGDWVNTTENTVYTIERNINDMNDFPLMGIDYLESL